MAATSANKIAEGFKNPTIPPIDGKPTHTNIHAMHDLLNSNAASVNTNLGCSTIGHLCPTLPPTVYAIFLETRVVTPPNPGAKPVILAGATGTKAASIRYAHDAETLALNTFRNVDRALQQQLLGSVKDNFIQVKHRPHRGYSGSSMPDLLTHIYETYAVIYNSEWLVKDKRFCKAYTPTDPIRVVWHHIDDAVA